MLDRGKVGKLTVRGLTKPSQVLIQVVQEPCLELSQSILLGLTTMYCPGYFSKVFCGNYFHGSLVPRFVYSLFILQNSLRRSTNTPYCIGIHYRTVVAANIVISLVLFPQKRICSSVEREPPKKHIIMSRLSNLLLPLHIWLMRLCLPILDLRQDVQRLLPLADVFCKNIKILCFGTQRLLQHDKPWQFFHVLFLLLP